MEDSIFCQYCGNQKRVSDRGFVFCIYCYIRELVAKFGSPEDYQITTGGKDGYQK
jgi:hypothetical protein